jgi:hypothetical protein
MPFTIPIVRLIGRRKLNDCEVFVAGYPWFTDAHLGLRRYKVPFTGYKALAVC